MIVRYRIITLRHLYSVNFSPFRAYIFKVRRIEDGGEKEEEKEEIRRETSMPPLVSLHITFSKYVCVYVGGVLNVKDT